MPERSSDNVHKIFFYIKEENKLTDSHVSFSDLYIFVIVQCLLTGISYGKSVDTAEKSALKFVNLSSLKVIRLKRAKI